MQSMTDEEIAGLRRCASDPVYFAEKWLGWKASEAQSEWLRGSTKYENYNRSGNRWGKTEATAIKHLWKCAFKIRPNHYSYELPYVTCNASLSLDQARLVITKSWRILHTGSAEAFRKCFIKRKVETPFPRIEFRNNSLMWARSTAKKGDYLHGHDYDYFSYDEGALDPNFGYVIDEVVKLRLTDRGGQFDAISTGKRGSEFNRRFQLAKERTDCYWYQGSSLSNPYIDQSSLQRIIATLSERLVEERVYGGEAQVEGMISSAEILKAIARGTGLTHPARGRRYSTGVDLGKKRSKTTILTLDITQQPYQIVAFERFNQEDVNLPEETTFWEYVYGRIRLRKLQYGGLLAVDATGLGDVVLDAIPELGAQAVMMAGSKRVEFLGILQMAFGLGIVGMPLLEEYDDTQKIWSFVDELESLEENTPGEEMDATVALALSLWNVREVMQQPQVVIPTRVASMKRL